MNAYRLGLGDLADPEPILAFLREHWRSDHAFVVKPELLAWQHRDASTGRYNFVTARPTENGPVHALLGYVPQAQFDRALPGDQAFLAIWRAPETLVPPAVGMSLLKWYLKQADPSFLGAIGLNPRVIPIYRHVLGFQVGQLDHHLLINPRVSRFRVAEVPEGLVSHAPSGASRDESSLSTFGEKELLALDPQSLARVFGESVPAKSPAFLVARYLRHPWYRYEVRGTRDDVGRLRSLFVTRQVSAGGGSVLRMVDFLGDDSGFAATAASWRRLLEERDAEYLDIYSHGLDPSALRAAGFVDRRASPGLLVPNYFEPFERKNVELDYAYRNRTGRPVRLFRGDTDQDRPNRFD